MRLMSKISYSAVLVLFLFLSAIVSTASDADELDERVENAQAVLTEIMDMPEKGIPYQLFDSCEAIAVIPHVVKAGFVIGGKYGKGVVSAKDKKTGKWSAPAFFTLAGGSYGFQAGVQAIDLVLLIMSERGLDGMLQSKVKLGADIGVAAGPVGRRAEAGTDLLLKAEILY